MKKLLITTSILLSSISLVHASALSPGQLDLTTYGGEAGHEIFEAKKAQTIKASAGLLKTMRSMSKNGEISAEDLTKVTNGIANARRKAAQESKSDAADQFGLKRNSRGTYDAHITNTTSDERAVIRANLGDLVKSALMGILSGVPEAEYVGIDQRWRYNGPGFTVEFLSNGFCKPLSTAIRAIVEVRARSGDIDSKELLEEQMLLTDVFKHLGSEERVRYFEGLIAKNTVVAAKLTFFAEMDETKIPLTTCMTLFEGDASTDKGFTEASLNDLGTTAPMSLLHTSKRILPVLEPTLVHFAHRAVNWDGENLDLLRANIVCYRYLSSQAMPYCRGSAAITNWTVAAILQSHGLKEDIGTWERVDDYSIAMSLDGFETAYEENVSITPIDGSQD